MSEQPVRWAFHHFGAAWYGKYARVKTGEVDSVTFGDYPEDGGTRGEMEVVWHTVGRLVPRLEVFDDAWHLLPMLSSVLADMAKMPGITPSRFCELLQRHGFADDTAYEEPTYRRGGYGDE